MVKVKGFSVVLEHSVSEEEANLLSSLIMRIRGVSTVKGISENILNDNIVFLRTKTELRNKLINFIKENL